MAGKKRHRWLGWEQEFLRQNYAGYQNIVLAAVLGCTEAQLASKANAMGLRKTPELLSQLARDRSSVPDHGGVQTRFKKGQVPPNKGQRRPGFAPGNMARSQFKPGNRPHTWVPVGSYRVVEGVLEVKYSDDPGPPGMRWKAYARVVWERANGPLPSGHAVVFLPGRATVDPKLVTLDAVECISRLELMRRNSIHRMPPELADVARLRGRLTRAIHAKEKE